MKFSPLYDIFIHHFDITLPKSTVCTSIYYASLTEHYLHVGL